MSKSSALIVLGLLTMLVPFSGLPASLRVFLAILFGASVVAIGLLLRVRETARSATHEEPELQSAQSEAPSVVEPAPAEESAPPSEPPHTISPI